MVADRQMVAEFERRRREAAKKHIGTLARAALKAGVRFDPVVETSPRPYDGIVATAKKRKCDLILMSSHGRRGFDRLVLGSVADKVIQRAGVPVLVYR
jgi:nucleotide-binding universal stress UspA family protein